MFDDYLLNNHRDDLIKILEDSETEKHFSLVINFATLFENCPELGNNILEDSPKTLKYFDKQVLKAQRKILEDKPEYTEKCHVHVRVTGLPYCPELHRTIFPTSIDIGSFLQVSGTVVRTTASKMLEYKRLYRCLKCKNISTIEANYEQRFVFQAPKMCPMGECYGKNMIQIKELDQDSCKDYQEVKLQEQVSKLDIGSMPTSIWVTLEDDLVDSCKPGDDITVTGTVLRRWKPQYPGKKLDIELVVRANHVEVNNDQRSIMLITPEIKSQFHDFWEKHKVSPLIARDIILQSVCPQLYGMYIVKLAVSVVLAGGSATHTMQNTGVRIRAEPHLLLVGDPGTGKSQLLRFASKIIPRSVLTTGIGCTSAGLTVTAVMEDGEWQLEAGALVLSDEGICCIDEFNSMKEHDRASIHEAMEQQTISVAKASMVCKLSTRCSVLAATNPKGHLDPSQSLSLNVAMASPLLSRFDLVLMLRDTVDSDWDEIVCDHILNDTEDKEQEKIWPVELLQAYFTVIKGLHPVLTEDANSILSSYYQAQRQAPTRNLARTTVRLLDSLVRLSQAHARLMYRSEVEVMDAIMAVALVESSMQGAALLLPVHIDTLHAPFPKDPMKSYVELLTTILQKLKLHKLLNAEVAKIQNSSYFNENSNCESSENIERKSSYFNDFEAQDSVDNSKNESENTKNNDSAKEIVNENEIVLVKRNDENNGEKSNYFKDLSQNKTKNNLDTSKINRKEMETRSKSYNFDEEIVNKKNFSNKSKRLKLLNKNNDATISQIENKIFPKPGPSKTKTVLNTSISQIENIIQPETSKRKKNTVSKPKKKSKLSETDLLNLIPSVNDIFEIDELNLELPNNEIIEENIETPSQVKRNYDKKITNFREQFAFKPKQKVSHLNDIVQNGEENVPVEVNIVQNGIDEEFETNDRLNVTNQKFGFKNIEQDNRIPQNKMVIKNTEKLVENCDTKIIDRKTSFLKTFAFKKTIRNDKTEEVINPILPKIIPNNKIEQRNLSQKTKSFESGTSSTSLSSKTLFQSQDLDLDDLDLDF